MGRFRAQSDCSQETMTHARHWEFVDQSKTNSEQLGSPIWQTGLFSNRMQVRALHMLFHSVCGFSLVLDWICDSQAELDKASLRAKKVFEVKYHTCMPRETYLKFFENDGELFFLKLRLLGAVFVTQHMLEVGRHLAWITSLFHCLYPGSWTRVIKRGNKLPYSLSHLADPRTFFSLLKTEFYEA